MKYRNKKYYEDVFNLIGKDEFIVADFREAAACVDENLGEDWIRTPDALQVWASSKTRCMKELPDSLVEVTKAGNSFKIKLHDPKAVAEELGVRWEKKSHTPKPTTKVGETTTKKHELAQKDEFFITFKSCRSAVRTGKGEDTGVEIEKKHLVDICKYKDLNIKYSIEQIITAIANTAKSFGLKLEAKLIGDVVIFQGQNKSLEKICAIGREVYPGMKCFLFEEAAGDAIKTIKEQKMEAATAVRKQQQVPTTTVLTDEERFKIFLCGGYIMEHDRAPMSDLQEYLESKGMSISTLKLESILKMAPEFVIEGNLVYLDSKSKDFWDKFRKRYRPIDSSDYEQVIFEMAVSLEYVEKQLNGCQVELARTDRPVYRVNIPRRSAVANKNFRRFLGKFHEGDYIYTDTAFLKKAIKKQEKAEADAILEDDVCRYEIGYFFNKKKGD